MQRPDSRLDLRSTAIVLRAPQSIELCELELDPPTPADVLVDMEWSGVSAGTERLLWKGEMPHFPGLGYPLVPGYEGVGRVVAAGSSSGWSVGQRVFVPGARCFGKVRGLFGSAASRVVVAGERLTAIDDGLGKRGLLLALAATARHAIGRCRVLPQVVIGHGVLGRLIARLCVLLGSENLVVWESNSERRSGAQGYAVISAAEDTRRDYQSICDVSGDASMLDALIERLAPQGELALAGFYSQPLKFAFPAAFMREIRLVIAAQWQRDDLQQVKRWCDDGDLSLDGLISHTAAASDAAAAYEFALTNPACLKMSIDWSGT